MQYTTAQYREEMRLPFRGQSSVYVYIGLINNDAQRNAYISSSFSGDESGIYNGSSTNGVVSTENDGSITFTFGDFYEINIAGLTLTFGTAPTSVTVTNGSKTESYNVGGSTEYTIDDGYTDCHYITITPNSGKLSIKSILFGVGIQFTNKQIITTNRSNVVNHISNDLPKKTFSVTVDNRAHLFNKDNPYGYADYFEEKQEVTYEYGREMSDGSIYKIKGGKVLLKKWTSNDYEATFDCVGYLDYLEGKYYKGQIYENGITAYQLAQDVFADAEITNYILDESLKQVKIFNPIPPCEYREALKMIANASRCTLYEDRDGNICLINGSTPSFVNDVQFTGAASYCIPNALFEDNSLFNYADAERDYVKADGTLLFLPENGSYRQVGFVSSQLANENGLFTNSPQIRFTFMSEYELSYLIFNFAVVVPTEMRVTCKLKNSVVNTQLLNNLTISTIYNYSGMIDEVIVEFLKAEPNQRIHLNNMILGGAVDYHLTYHELKETPIASSLEKVSNIKIHTYMYNKEKTEEGSSRSSYVRIDRTENDDGGDTIDVTTGQSQYGSAIATVHAVAGDNFVTFERPYYNYKATTGTIKETGVYYLVLNSPFEQDIDIYANPYTITDNIYTHKVHEKGVEKNSTNNLVSTETMAKQQAEWLKDYYDDDLEYSLTYRGDPVLDADDVIYLENNYVANNQIRIEEESISTSTGMNFTCKLLARRTMYQTDADLSRLIVGRGKIGETV